MDTNNTVTPVRTGWDSLLAKLSMVSLLFLSITGLVITFVPFHAAVQWNVLLHTGVGLLTLLPIVWYYVIHFLDYRRYAMSHVLLLGYVGVAALLVCTLSGLVVTWQGLFGVRTSWLWRQIHLISTFVTIGAALPHVFFSIVHMKRGKDTRPVRPFVWQTSVLTIVGLLVTFGLVYAYSGEAYVNELPEGLQLRLRRGSAVRAEPGQDVHRRRVRPPLARRLGELRHRRLPLADPRRVEAQRPPLVGDGQVVPGDSERDGRAERPGVHALLRWLPTIPSRCSPATKNGVQR